MKKIRVRFKKSFGFIRNFFTFLVYYNEILVFNDKLKIKLQIENKVNEISKFLIQFCDLQKYFNYNLIFSENDRKNK